MKIYLSTIILGIILSACGSADAGSANQISYKPGTTIETVTTEENIPQTSSPKTFVDVHNVIKQQCLACHGASGGFSIGTSATPFDRAQAYSNIMIFVNDLNAPSNNRLLLKASGTSVHGGGNIFSTTSYEYDLISTWIKAGAPLDATITFDVGTLALVTEPRPGYDTPTAEAKSFSIKHKGGFNPVQGQACIKCHQNETQKDILRFGGTLLSYIHTPNAQYYQDLSTYTINLIGNNGTNLSANTNPSGSEIGHNNFYIKSEDGNFINAELFTAYIKNSAGDVINQSGLNTHNSSTHRDCNSCHSKAGINGAPGRVLVPLVN